MPAQFDDAGVIVNATDLIADDVAHKRVLCPWCRDKVFSMWLEGLDAHAAFRCTGVEGTLRTLIPPPKEERWLDE